MMCCLVEETSIEDKAHELKSKDESIATLEDVIKDKSASIASLQSEVNLLEVISHT